jgi:hypothetical protein
VHTLAYKALLYENKSIADDKLDFCNAEKLNKEESLPNPKFFHLIYEHLLHIS